MKRTMLIQRDAGVYIRSYVIVLKKRIKILITNEIHLPNLKILTVTSPPIRAAQLLPHFPVSQFFLPIATTMATNYADLRKVITGEIIVKCK